MLPEDQAVFRDVHGESQESPAVPELFESDETTNRSSTDEAPAEQGTDVETGNTDSDNSENNEQNGEQSAEQNTEVKQEEKTEQDASYSASKYQARKTKGKNSFSSPTKKVYTMDEICIPQQEYNEHLNDRLVVNELVQKSVNDLTRKYGKPEIEESSLEYPSYKKTKYERTYTWYGEVFIRVEYTWYSDEYGHTSYGTCNIDYAQSVVDLF